jgi:hypothetical protein
LLLVITIRTNQAVVGPKVKTSAPLALDPPRFGFALNVPSSVDVAKDASDEAYSWNPRRLMLSLSPTFQRAIDSMTNEPPRSKSKWPGIVPDAEIQELLPPPNMSCVGFDAR